MHPSVPCPIGSTDRGAVAQATPVPHVLSHHTTSHRATGHRDDGQPALYLCWSGETYLYQLFVLVIIVCIAHTPAECPMRCCEAYSVVGGGSYKEEETLCLPH